ncbi:uncharacterized protein TRIVIDRAFT_226162 [Trichoderma virens Gv29-8]|uniref:Uncharacterized protein n=1 Tax=Hypocrea virens (strain Gv29-8 / FGSC 10586) TaxID=413071 RepID=G9N5K1_HYPVG|nr:uncharacterized protein TRIVIDRAFT_226162 [Trichoderma virens Gv29-8]EHK18043.1 hypothetical protein TRIVIDRAFT_226162 [Trichoderma virens Gv29-8]UKZ54091.1 hypothetical protein TrVGV298_007897 [Trichoderma virens]
MSAEAHDVNSKTREALLSELTSTLGPYVYEASAVHRSGEYNREKLEYYHTPISCLALFEGHGDPSRRADEIKKATELELENIKLFHENIVQPLVPCFKNWASENFDNLVSQLGLSEMSQLRCTNPNRFITELSVVENARVYRAFYRFQFSSNLYRVIRTHTPHDILNQQSHIDNFFKMFERWEIEEVLTVSRFAMRRCADFLPNGVSFTNRLPNAIFLGNGIPVTREEIDKGNIMRGLVILKRFCLEGKHDEIRKLVSGLNNVVDNRWLGNGEEARRKLLIPSLTYSQGGEIDDKELIGLTSLNLSAHSSEDWKFMEFLENLYDPYYFRVLGCTEEANRFKGDRIPDDFTKDKFPSFSWCLSCKARQWSSDETEISSLINTGYVFWDETRFGPDEVAALLGRRRGNGRL